MVRPHNLRCPYYEPLAWLMIKLANQNPYEILLIITKLIQQLNVLQYNTFNSTLMYYFEIRQAIS